MQSTSNDVIERVAACTLERGGATFDLATNSFVNPGSYWYFPKYPSRTRIVDQATLRDELAIFIEQNRDACREVDVWLGTWINPHSKKCYLDIVTRMTDKTEAIRSARRVSETEARKIVTVYNPSLGETEYVWKDVRL